MMNLNKNFIALTCVCLPTQCWSQDIKEFKDFVGLSYEIGWRAWASGYRNIENSDIASDLKNQRFEDSIFNIIAQGIRDCALQQGVFSKKNQKVAYADGKPLRLIDCNADHKLFKQGEWNTILLFNYLMDSMFPAKGQFNIYQSHQDAQLVADARQRLQKVRDNLFGIYKGKGISDDKLSQYLNQAYKDIDTYATSLRSYHYLHEYQRLKRQKDRPDFSPNTINCSNFDQNTKSGSFRLSGACIDLEGKKTPTTLDIIVEDGKVSQYKLWDNSGSFDKDFNLIGKFKTFKENFRLDNDFIEKQFKDKLLKPQQIHNLSNYHEDMTAPPAVRDKCYLNSCLQAFHASATIRENVERLSKINAKRYPYWGPNHTLNMIDVSPVLQTIFTAIENGGMERWVNGQQLKTPNMQAYQEAILKLADSLEHSEALIGAKLWHSGNNLNPTANEIIQQYKNLLTLKNWSVPLRETSDPDFRLGAHCIRFTGMHRPTVIAQELAHALGIEAFDKKQDPIAPVQARVIFPNQRNIIKNVERFPFNNAILDAPEITTSRQEVLQRIEEKNPYSIESTSLYYAGCTEVPQVSPVIIRPIKYKVTDKWIQIVDQTAYKEITQVVNGREHKYRLVALVHFLGGGGHFKATVLTQDGWVNVDDYKKNDDITKVSDYDENSGQAWGENRAVVIYEPLY